MKFFGKSSLLVASLALTASMCGGSDDTPPDKGTLKIALVDSLSVEYDDESRRLPESIRELCGVLTSDAKDCKRTYVLDPLLIRLDLDKNISLKTTIEKGGAKNVNNPKVIGKLIQRNFDDLDIPKEFSAQQAVGKDIGNLINTFVATESANDSVVIFNDRNSTEPYFLNGKDYKVFSDINNIRSWILSILCQNDKANFTLLINPPVLGSKPANLVSNPLSEPKPVSVKPVIRPKPGMNHSVIRPQTRINGDLTIIKGSEGCDECMHYYSATDNTGRVHEVKEKNSTFCCPCEKTIEVKGRTYRMECDGAGTNRLIRVD